MPGLHLRAGGAGALAAELPQMMVGVHISPAHPIGNRHDAKYRMRPKFRRGAETADQLNQHLLIGRKFYRLGSTTLLIGFRHGCDAMWPSRQQIQRNYTLQAGKWSELGARRTISQTHQITIAEMAHGLVRRHAAPTANALRRESLQARFHFLNRGWFRQFLHTIPRSGILRVSHVFTTCSYYSRGSWRARRRHRTPEIAGIRGPTAGRQRSSGKPVPR